MPRYRLTLEYDGTDYVGWQRQDNGPSIQAALEAAIDAFCGKAVTVHGSGRTDAGVHALGQVAHVDLPAHETDTIRDAINYHLKPQPIVILDVNAVPDTFEARFSARERHYLYRILDRRARPTLRRMRVWHTGITLNDAAMHNAAQALVGKHDFTTFRAAACQAKSPVKTLNTIAVRRIDDEIHIIVSARSFLHHQVRSITGSLHHVGAGKWPETGVAEALKAADRKACGPVAPAEGLYLVRVDY